MGEHITIHGLECTPKPRPKELRDFAPSLRHFLSPYLHPGFTLAVGTVLARSRHSFHAVLNRYMVARSAALYASISHCEAAGWASGLAQRVTNLAACKSQAKSGMKYGLPVEIQSIDHVTCQPGRYDYVSVSNSQLPVSFLFFSFLSCCCFGDSTTTVDRVPRHLLWQKLQSCGIDGSILAAFHSLYHSLYVQTAMNSGGHRRQPYVVSRKAVLPR